MNTLTIKIPPELEQEIVLASQREHLSKSELVRRALVAYVSQRKAGTPTMSALEQAGKLPQDVRASDRRGRLDLTALPLVCLYIVWRGETRATYALVWNAILNFDSLNAGR